MFNPATKVSNYFPLLGIIDPDAYTAATYTTGWIHAGSYAKIVAWVFAGTLGASATLDAKIEQASDGSGTGAKDVTGALITQLTQAGTDSDKQATIELEPASLDTNNGFDYVRLSMTVGTATSDAAAVVFGVAPRYVPPTDASTVDEIVTV